MCKVSLKTRGLAARFMLGLGLLFLISSSLFAGIDPKIERIETAPSGPPLSLLDIDGIKTAVSSDAPFGLSPDKIHNRISMYTNPNYEVYFGTAMEIEVTMEVKKYTYVTDVSPAETENITLTIMYDPFSGTQHIHSQGVRDFGFRKMELELTEIKVDNVSQDELPALVIIEAGIIIVKHTEFSFPGDLDLEYNVENVGCVDKPTNLHITWNDAIESGAIEYQLEWLHINDYGPINYSPTPEHTVLDSTKLNYNFKFNSTRITTIYNHYDLSLIFDRGYVLFRVRAVGIDLNGNYLFGPWSPVNQEGTVAAFPTSSRYHIEASASHEQLLNWQYAATYAEEGKRKEVISYFDGSLRNRQTVTRINSDENVIVGETIYDHQGRPAITVLPAPVPACDSNSQQVIQFFPNFNRNDQSTPYNRYNFDTIPNAESTCDLEAGGMSTSSGAAQYYSNFNPDQFGPQAYVPSSQVALGDTIAYPFVQVEYTPDNTGRIRRQGGVGPDYQLGSGHETQYIYSAPNQVELDRLFGSEVGYSAHYKKNTVVDAHGQASISYLDQEGRVIATALAGGAPENLEAITSEANAEVTLTINAFDTLGLNNVDESAQTILFSRVIGVSYDSEYSFSYSLTIAPFTDECVPDICFECVYDLTYELIDECGNNRFDNLPPMVGRFSLDSLNQPVFHTLCEEGDYTLLLPLQDSTNFMVNLTVGYYQLNKKLRVNQAAKDAFVATYLANDTCLLTLDDFIEEALSNVNFDDCDMDCESCLEQLGTSADYVSNGGSLFDYNAEYELCMELCNEGNPYSFCEISLGLMIADMMPNGQYGKVYNAQGEVVGNASTLSVYNMGNNLPELYSIPTNYRNPVLVDRTLMDVQFGYFEANGDSARVFLTQTGGVFYPLVDDPNTNVKYDASTNQYYTYPEHLALLSDFIERMNYAWARSLVVHHPEFCSYVHCIRLEDFENDAQDYYTSIEFDNLLFKVNTFEDAMDAGFIPTVYQDGGGFFDLSTLDWFTGANTESTPKDPFGEFAGDISADIGEAECDLSDLKNRFENYLEINGTMYSMPEVAAYMARCADNFYSSYSNGCFNFGGQVPLGYIGDEEELHDKEWQLLKSMYISTKQQYLTDFLDCTAGRVCGYYTGCIGNASYNPFFDFSSGNGGFSWINPDFFATDQPCGYFNFNTYKNLQRRFTSVEDALPFQTPNEVAYQAYLLTGQCPVPFTLQNFLTELAQNGNFSTGVPLLNVYSGLSAVLQAGNNFNMPGTIPFLEQIITTNTATDLVVRWMDGSTTHTILGFSKTSSVNWSDITQFLNFSSTSSNTFTVVGYTASNDPVQITGTISSNFSLEPCFFNSVGTQNALGSNLQFLLSALAQTSNLTATSLAVTPMIIGGNPVQVVGENIQNLFGNSPNLEWSQTSSWTFELKNTNDTCQRYIINFVNIPSGLNSYDIIMFENLMSTGGHTFSITAHTITETFELSGSATFNNCGDVIGIPQGNFGLPTPMTCMSSEHEAAQILVDVLAFMFQNQTITDSINLLQSPFMQAPLTAQFYPADSTTSEINGGFTEMIFSLGIEDCDIKVQVVEPLSIPSGATAPNLSEVTAITSFYTTGQSNFFNHYTELILNVIFDNDSFPTGQVHVIAPCLNLQSCDPCPDEYIFDLPDIPSMEAFLSAKAASGEIVADKSVQSYNIYSAKVDSFNVAHSYIESDSAFIVKLSYQKFLEQGFLSTGVDYVVFLNKMTDEVDEDTYLRYPHQFILDHGAGTNVFFEYERYLKATELYNDRAQNESLPLLNPIAKELYAHAKLARNNQLYIDYIQLMPFDESPALDILNFFELDTNTLINTTEDSLYAFYVDAYFDFLADSASYQMLCERTDILPTLRAFEDLDEAFLFCSEDAKQLVYDYIEALESRCVGELPKLRACDITKRDSDLEVQRFYIYYLELLKQFNQTEWSSSNAFELFSSFRNKDHFWIYHNRGLILGYAEHISAYKNPEPNVASTQQYEPLPLEIYDYYYQALTRGEESDCKDEYAQYLSCWNHLHNYYKDSLAHLSEFRHFSFTVFTNSQFMARELCDCVDAFCDSVNFIVSNNIIPTVAGLTSLLLLEDLCPTVIEYNPSTGDVDSDEPCEYEFVHYNDCLLNFRTYYLANLVELPEFEEFDLYFYDYPEFVNNNLCHCVDEFCAQLQAIIDGIVVPTPEIVYNILYMNNLCKNPCTPSVSEQVPLLPPTVNLDMDTLGPCERMLYNHAVFEAMNNYQNYLDSVVGTISQMYVNHCLGATETLTYSYQDKQYHYTLYYYDQAGNLIKTIPPAGVQQLDITASDSPLAIACKNDRLNNTKNVFTRHRLPTRYEYNSLNQLVGQNTPDTDPMNIFEPSLPNGLHPQLITNKIQMVNEAIGYLAGYVTMGSNDIGYLYKTTDAGNTWSRVHGLAAVDFKDVLMINNSTGYAVGAPGLLFKTQDGGQNWMLQNFWIQQNSGEVRSLNALAYESNTLVIAGDKGLLVNLNTSTNTYTFISGVSADVDFTAVTVISGTYYLSANHTDGYALVYEFDGSATPVAMTEYSPTRMRHIDVQNGTAYLAGDDGRIYVKPDAWNTTNDVWIEKESRLIGNIQKIVAFSDMQMLALVDEQIWRTTDGGITWGVASSDYTVLDIHKAANGSSAIAIGQNANYQVISYFVPNAANNYGAAQTQNLPMTLGAEPIEKVWHHTLSNGGQNKTLIAYISDDTLRFSKNGLVSNPVWSKHALNTSLDIVDIKFTAAGSYGAPELKGLILLSDGSLLRVATTASTVVASTGVATDVAAIANKDTYIRTITTTGQRWDWSVADNGTVNLVSSGGTQSISGLVNNLQQADVLVCDGNNNIIVSDFTYRVNMNLTTSYENITNQTRNTKLWALTTTSGSEAVLSGNTGALYVLESGVWKQQTTNRKDHFYALIEHNNQIYTAGQNGHLSRGFVSSGDYPNTYLQSTQTGSVTQNVSQDFYAIGSNGDNMYVVGAGGRVAFSPNVTSSNFSILNFGTKNLNTVCGVGTAGHVLIMGQESSLYRTNSASAILNKNIHVPALSDVHFSSISTGYVVGADFTVRRTNNAGTSWNTIKPNTLTSVATNFDLHLVHCVSYNDAYIFGDAGAARVNAQGVATAVPSFATNIRAIDAQNSKLIALSGNNTIHRYTLSTSGISFVSTITGSGTYNAIAYQNADNVMAVGMSAVFHYFASNNAAITVSTPTPVQITGDMRAIDVKGTYIVVAGDNGKYFRMTSSGMNSNGEHQNIQWIEMDGIYLSGSDLYRNPSTWESYITAANQINIRSVAIASATQVVFGGNYNSAFFSTTGLTNASVQYPYVRTAFDPGDRYSSLFYYDKLGRLVVSQNARQRNSEDRRFSYTVYDELGRVVEVGEKFENETLADGTLGVFYFRDIFGSMVSGHYNPKVIDNDKLKAWIGGDGARNEVTRSYYDVFRDDFYTPPFAVNQDNQRKRIAHVAYYSTWDDENLVAVEEYEHATHFVYDIHGNVTKLMQDNRKMATDFESLAEHRIKTMEYSYDLVSGNVHRMSVQTGESDQWHHAYSYDADNRIIEVHTSTQTPILDINMPAQSLENELEGNSDWTLEAKYFYYAHGPLARTELGNQLQGLDYIYNLQGWLKGVNATSLDNALDPGGDGLFNTPDASFSKDVMAFSLHYYQGDYTPIGGAGITPAMGINYTSHAATAFANTPDLYNGNIRFMQTTLTDIATRDSLPMLNAYKYDQLNRLLEARSYTDGLSGNVWNPTAYGGKYFNKFTYDANGNILTQQRRNSAGAMLDSLTYHYLLDDYGNLVRNRLYHVNDSAGFQNAGDLTDQGTFVDTSYFAVENYNNYKYDEEGRLIQDLAEGIENIIWRVDGKVKKVLFTSASGKNHLEFDYDAFGRRIAKHSLNQSNILIKSTYYILDASGNQLLTFEHVPENDAPFELAERVIYGSSRLGINVKKVDMLDENPEEIISLELGNKLYEMSNHLGNVLTVINDIKVPYLDGSAVAYYATIVSTADYSPFGVQLDGRTVSASSYRYGFQGYEEDSEIKGQGNSYTTEYRQYDPRLGRWLSLDPLMDKYPDISPYASYANNPIFFIDVDGDSIGIYTVDKNGKFTHIKTIDSEDDYDMIYTVEDWNNKNYSNGEGIWDRTILATLSDPNQVEMTPCSGGGGCYPIKQPDGSYQYQTPVVTATGDANEINKLFFWLANNVNEHEFIVYQGVIAGKTVTTISTFVNHEFGRDHAPSYAMAGFQLAQVTMAIHNHPEKVWRDNRNTSERNSMGVRDDGKADGDWSAVITMYYSSGNKDPFPFYVYFQNSNNLYVITAAKGPVLQGKITNHTQINYRGKKRK